MYLIIGFYLFCSRSFQSNTIICIYVLHLRKISLVNLIVYLNIILMMNNVVMNRLKYLKFFSKVYVIPLIKLPIGSVVNYWMITKTKL